MLSNELDKSNCSDPGLPRVKSIDRPCAFKAVNLDSKDFSIVSLAILVNIFYRIK